MTRSSILARASKRAVRLQLSRAKGFDLQAHSLAVNGLSAVNVGRPSRMGNPFRIGGWFRMGDARDRFGPLTAAYMQCLSDLPEHRAGFTEIKDAATAVEWFRRYRQANPLPPDAVAALRGKNLACWCAPGCPCHADVLLELANPTPSPEAP